MKQFLSLEKIINHVVENNLTIICCVQEARRNIYFLDFGLKFLIFEKCIDVDFGIPKNSIGPISIENCIRDSKSIDRKKRNKEGTGFTAWYKYSHSINPNE